MYRNVPKNLFQNVGKCTEKTISKVIWVGKGTLDVILSQINKKIGDRFHFQWYRRRVNYQFFNYVTDKVNGSRVQPSLFGEDQRPDPGDGGNRAYLNSGNHYSIDSAMGYYILQIEPCYLTQKFELILISLKQSTTYCSSFFFLFWTSWSLIRPNCNFLFLREFVNRDYIIK